MRGGLDDALDKLARRDELRRRAAGEGTSTPPPVVHELVEAIAGVVSRHPKLEVTVGVEGVGDPTLLHFYVQEGMVQVSADTQVASRVTDATPLSPPRHAEFDFDLDDPADEPPGSQHGAHPASPAYPASTDAGEQTHRIRYDDPDRYTPGTGYKTTTYGEPDPYARPVSGYDDVWQAPRESAFPTDDSTDGDSYRSPLDVTSPPPVPAQTTRRIRPEHHRAPEEPTAAQRSRAAEWAVAEQRGMPTPVPEPIPLQVDSAQTEMAAKRLAALVRDNPALLRQAPLD